MDIYLHGIETIEKSDGPRPVETIDTGIIALIGTAPDANPTLVPTDKSIPIHGISGLPAGLGETGTLPDALAGIFDQAGKVSQTVLMVRVEEGEDVWETMANIIGNATTRTGLHAFRDAPNDHGLTPKLMIAPGFTSQRPTDGVASIAISGTGNVGYKSTPSVAITGGGGVGATAVAVVNSETEKLTAIIVTNPGVGYTSAPTVTISGGDPTTAATATATLGTVANPVVIAMLAMADMFRAGVIKDSLATTTSAAISDRGDYDTDRLLIVEPMVKVFKGGTPINQPASARVAGLQARVDYEMGFWHSPSNKVLKGVIGTSRSIEHSFRDPAAESQLLNRNAVACVVRAKSGGFKLWGSRVPSSDTLKKFWSVRRAHDTIIDSIEIAAEPFIDEPFSLQALVDIAETVNAALRRWTGLGATLGGRVWLDPALNTKETWANGHLYVSYDAESPAPIEHITFVFNRNTGYYETLSANAVREIARMAGTTLLVA